MTGSSNYLGYNWPIIRFADVLLIANQDRPRLFDLEISKPTPVFERVLEIDERLDAEGRVSRAPDPAVVARLRKDPQVAKIVAGAEALGAGA